MVLKIILAIAVIWLVLAVIGFVVKSLFWLGIIAGVLFLVTSAWGWMKKNSS